MKGSVQITYVDSKLEKYDNGYELLMNFDDMQKVYDAHMYIVVICLCLYHFVAWLLVN